ncbi:MAG: thiamine ABC transporter ATP-binding protein, partial [Arsenophonus sp. ER-BJ3-MAG3]
AFDPVLRNEMLILLKQVCNERQLTLLIISHSLEDVSQIASRSIVIVNGRITYNDQLGKLIDGSIPDSILFGISNS